MKLAIEWASLIAFSLVTGCAAVQTGGEVVRRRAAFLAGWPEESLANFHRAAHLDPDYVTGLLVFKEGVGRIGGGQIMKPKIMRLRISYSQA